MLVLLHGMGACWQWWLECLPALAESGRIIAVDLPGFGDSEPLPVPWTMDDQASSVLALLATLGIDRAAVAGHSMGGLVAARMAQTRADVVSRLVLVDAGGVPMSERRLRVVLRFLSLAHRNLSRPGMLSLLARSRRSRRVLLRSAMADPDTMSDRLAAVVMPRLDAPGFVPALAASARAVRASAPESIRVPTLLIWGDRDVFAPLHTAEAMLRRLPDGALSVLPGVGHSPMVEAPEQLTALLVEHALSRGAPPSDRQEDR